MLFNKVRSMYKEYGQGCLCAFIYDKRGRAHDRKHSITAYRLSNATVECRATVKLVLWTFIYQHKEKLTYTKRKIIHQVEFSNIFMDFIMKYPGLNNKIHR